MRWLLLACASLFWFGCNSDSGPGSPATPPDGSYRLTSDVCDGTSTGATGTLTISSTGSTFQTGDVGGGCQISFGIELAYSGTNGISTTQVSKSCGASCSGTQCTANTTRETTISGTWSYSAPTLTLNLTNFNCATNSGGGTQTDVKTLTRL